MLQRVPTLLNCRHILFCSSGPRELEKIKSLDDGWACAAKGEKKKEIRRIEKAGSHDSYFLIFFSFLFFHAHSRFYSCGSGWKFLANNGRNDDKTIKFNLTLAPRPHFEPGICWIHMRKWVMAFNFKLQAVRRALFPERLRVRYQLVNRQRVPRRPRDYRSKSSHVVVFDFSKYDFTTKW